MQELIGDWLAAVRLREHADARQPAAPDRRHGAGRARSSSAGGLLVWWRRDRRRCTGWPTCLRPAILIGLVPPLCETDGVAERAQRLHRHRRLRAAGRAPVPHGLRGRRGDAPAAAVDFATATALLERSCRRACAAGCRRLLVLAGVDRLRRLLVRVHAAHARPLPDLQLRSRPVRQPLLEHDARHPLRDYRRSASTRTGRSFATTPTLSVFFFLPVLRDQAGRTDAARHAVVRAGRWARSRSTGSRRGGCRAGTRSLIAFAYLLYPPMHGHAVLRLPLAADRRRRSCCSSIDFVDERRYWLCALAFIIAARLPRGHLRRAGDPGHVPGAVRPSPEGRPGHGGRASGLLRRDPLHHHAQLRRLGLPGHLQGSVAAGAPNFGGIIATLVSNPMFTLRVAR